MKFPLEVRFSLQELVYKISYSMFHGQPAEQECPSMKGVVLNFHNLNGLPDLLGNSLISSRYTSISQKAVPCPADRS